MKAPVSIRREVTCDGGYVRSLEERRETVSEDGISYVYIRKITEVRDIDPARNIIRYLQRCLPWKVVPETEKYLKEDTEILRIDTVSGQIFRIPKL